MRDSHGEKKKKKKKKKKRKRKKQSDGKGFSSKSLPLSRDHRKPVALRLLSPLGWVSTRPRQDDFLQQPFGQSDIRMTKAKAEKRDRP